MIDTQSDPGSYADALASPSRKIVQQWSQQLPNGLRINFTIGRIVRNPVPGKALTGGSG